jgi:hypothetical protein
LKTPQDRYSQYGIHNESHPFWRFECSTWILTIYFSSLRNIPESFFVFKKIAEKEIINHDLHLSISCYDGQFSIQENTERKRFIGQFFFPFVGLSQLN